MRFVRLSTRISVTSANSLERHLRRGQNAYISVTLSLVMNSMNCSPAFIALSKFRRSFDVASDFAIEVAGDISARRARNFVAEKARCRESCKISCFQSLKARCCRTYDSDVDSGTRRIQPSESVAVVSTNRLIYAGFPVAPYLATKDQGFEPCHRTTEAYCSLCQQIDTCRNSSNTYNPFFNTAPRSFVKFTSSKKRKA